MSTCPWGKIQLSTEIGQGIRFVSTPSHGGFYVPPTLWATMPEPYQRTFAGGAWYEEDCDWAKVVLSFPKLFSEQQHKEATATALQWFPDAYKAVTGEK